MASYPLLSVAKCDRRGMILNSCPTVFMYLFGFMRFKPDRFSFEPLDAAFF